MRGRPELQRRRARRPGFESLERRELLASTRPIAPRGLAGQPRLAIAELAAGSADSTTPPWAGVRSFFAAFNGTYAVGKGRIAGQSLRTYLNGAGTSNLFLHGQVQVGIASPVDPRMGLAGTASLFDKNYAQTGNILVLDLEGEPGPSLDGRPTQLSWIVSDNSSGSFTGASGQGTLTISYHRGGRRQPLAIDSGRMGVQFRGQIAVSGTSNPFRVT